jgi:hypothetical protein
MCHTCEPFHLLRGRPCLVEFVEVVTLLGGGMLRIFDHFFPLFGGDILSLGHFCTCGITTSLSYCIVDYISLVS